MVRLNALTAAAEIVRGNLRFFNKKNAALLALSDEVCNLRDVKAPEMLRSTQETHKDSKMNGDDWNPFRIDYTGNVDEQIKSMLGECAASITRLRGEATRQRMFTCMRGHKKAAGFRP